VVVERVALFEQICRDLEQREELFEVPRARESGKVGPSKEQLNRKSRAEFPLVEIDREHGFCFSEAIIGGGLDLVEIVEIVEEFKVRLQ